jgi:hypothetical protein
MNNKIQSPIRRVNDIIDNPLLSQKGIPITENDFIDSTERISDEYSSKILRKDRNIWHVDPGVFYDNSGLSGIDTRPEGSKNFDLGKFNKVFNDEKKIMSLNHKVNDEKKLNDMSFENKTKSLYDLSVLEIIINAKNAWFECLDDILDQKFYLETFTKNNRLFYIGITILVFASIMYIYALTTRDNVKKEDNIQKIYHIYQYPEDIHGGLQDDQNNYVHGIKKQAPYKLHYPR